jgi:hypothetical protein
LKNPKIGTVALIINPKGDPELLDQFSDDREISILEAAFATQEPDPLSIVYSMRQKQCQEDEEFGDYVEELLSQPFVRPEVQEHGVQWLRSKIRIEEYQKCESQATKVIAEYAFKLFKEDPNRTEFILAGPAAKVRIRVFLVPERDANEIPNAA